MTDAPPSTRSSVSGRPRAAVHGVDHVAGLVGHGLDHGPGQVGPPDAPGHTDEGAPGVGVPPRAAEPGEGRAPGRRRRCRRPSSASGPISAASAMMPSPSRSHWTAAPVTKMAPSRA